jgi:hypothetical protein
MARAVGTDADANPFERNERRVGNQSVGLNDVGRHFLPFASAHGYSDLLLFELYRDVSVVAFFLPETKGKTLEVEQYFETGGKETTPAR